VSVILTELSPTSSHYSSNICWVRVYLEDLPMTNICRTFQDWNC